MLVVQQVGFNNNNKNYSKVELNKISTILIFRLFVSSGSLVICFFLLKCAFIVVDSVLCFSFSLFLFCSIFYLVAWLMLGMWLLG